MKRILLLSLLAAGLGSRALAQNPSSTERFASAPSELIAAEQGYWERVSLPVPDGVVMEASGILAVPGKRLLVTTRRGEMWWVDGAYEADPHPKYTLFASGLHEPLGVVAAPQGGYYVAQREEITHIADMDGDGRADLFETVWKIAIYGNYHEYAFGPVMGPNGNLRVTLNVSFGAPTQSSAPWRGWMMEITPDGHSTPIAAGLRSPCGFTVTSKGDWFYAENQGQSKIMRMSLEKVQGVWQGACYPFLSGFDSGIIRLAWGEDGVLFSGETARGWGSVGGKDFALERVTWKGKAPFDVQEITAQPDGFVLKFTEPVDPVTAADPASYSVSGFIYKHHRMYGSSIINRLGCPVLKVVVAPDGRSVRLGSACLREGYIHEIKVRGVRSAAAKAPVLHDTAYYTLNRFPDGARILPAVNTAELCVATVPAAANAVTAKHPTVIPKEWSDNNEDVTLVVGTVPGLKYDTTLLKAKAGACVRVVFKNNDDMLHNFVLVKPGRGNVVGQAAMELGLDGLAR